MVESGRFWRQKKRKKKKKKNAQKTPIFLLNFSAKIFLKS
jgi:hypothetical protein